MKMLDSKIIQCFKSSIPSLNSVLHKGSCGRIGIIGGSFEYTGAPYFAAISALKVGADLVHVFCTGDAANAIKSYSPELIVHPLLDAPAATAKISDWLDRLHSLVIGPGLGRDNSVLNTVKEVIRTIKKPVPLIIDADGLQLLLDDTTLFQNYAGGVIITPNAVEYTRLISKVGLKNEEIRKLGSLLNVVVLKKGQVDEICGPEELYSCNVEGSFRRCGGQGDVLSGILGTFSAWNDNYPEVTCYAACAMTKTASKLAFAKYKRSMTASGLIEHIQGAFYEVFEMY